MHRKILSSIVSMALFIGVNFASADTRQETPQEGLRAIVELYKSKDWEGLVKERCLDVGHAESEEALNDLVANLSSQFSEDDTLAALVTSYEAALSQEPQIQSEGSVAIFSSDVGSVKLSRMDNGTWGLHF